MRSYKDIDTFADWEVEEKNQFALAVTKGLIMIWYAKRILDIAEVQCHQRILHKYFSQNT